MQDVTVAERWTQERRREHTRGLLLDAAEQVFAKKGYEGASLDEIADTAGYTRGAIYKHFGGKTELFFEVNKRFNGRFLEGFLEVLDPAAPVDDLDLDAIAKVWHTQQSDDPLSLALGFEFIVYVLRHPEMRPVVAAQRQRVAAMIAAFIDEQAARFGITPRIPSMTLARIALAASDGLQLARLFDEHDEDLYEPFLELFMSSWLQHKPTPIADVNKGRARSSRPARTPRMPRT